MSDPHTEGRSIMTTRSWLRALLLALLAGAAVSAQSWGQDAPSGQPKKRGELRVYVFDAANKPAAPPAESRIYLEPKAGGRQVLRPVLVAGSSATPSDALHHGGQIQRLRSGETIELVIVPPDAAPVASSAQSFLRAELDLVEYVCPMKCAVDVKPADCPKCGMEMLPSLLELDAVVAVKLHGEWTNAKGFRFPVIQPPKTFREAIEQMAALTAEIKARVDEGKLDRVHTPALSIGEIGKLLRGLAGEAKVDDTAVAPVGARLVSLGQELDRAADTACAVDTVRLLGELQSRVESLRGLAR